MDSILNNHIKVNILNKVYVDLSTPLLAKPSLIASDAGFSLDLLFIIMESNCNMMSDNLGLW